jgi:hypothetical protein
MFLKYLKINLLFIYFNKNHFRTEDVSPLLELLILNSNKLQGLQIEKAALNAARQVNLPLEEKQI